MKILHMSDTHGYIKHISEKYDIIVHSGDILPDFYVPSGSKQILANNQLEWLYENANDIKSKINYKPFLFTTGNHDYLDSKIIESILIKCGVDAIDLTNKIISYNHLNFYGFPYIPYINGFFSNEKNPLEMEGECQLIESMLENYYVDVFVSHCPLKGILDKNKSGISCGCKQLYDIFSSLKDKPQCFLHGHVHNAYGEDYMDNMLINNAATKTKIINVNRRA
jgi:Icc-related predicted phosphoesterase